MIKEDKRKENEKKFGKWKNLSSGGRRYFYTVTGKQDYKARYIKEVNANEQTIKFYQEIYNQMGKLVEIHEKYPKDKGHIKISGGENNENNSSRSKSKTD